MSTPPLITTLPPLDGKSVFLASGLQHYEGRQSSCQDKRESDAICTRFHGACCGAVSRHPAQALAVRGRVLGGAAQSSSQLALPLCNAALLGGDAPMDSPDQPVHLHHEKSPRHVPEASLLSLRNCLWDDSTATKL